MKGMLKFKKQNKIQDMLNVNPNFVATSVESPKTTQNNENL